MVKLSYAQQLKSEQLNRMLFVITQASKNGVVLYDEFIKEVYRVQGLSPTTVRRYLNELKDLGEIEINEIENKIIRIDPNKPQEKTTKKKE